MPFTFAAPTTTEPAGEQSCAAGRWSGRAGHSDGHAGFVAGRYRDGAFSDAWTDVSRCAERTFTGYAAACSCGWRGPVEPATAAGYDTCRRLWLAEHRPRLLA